MKLYHFKHFSKVFRISSILSINTTYSLHKYLSNKDKCISTPLIFIKFFYNLARRARAYLSYSLDINNLLDLIFSLFPAFPGFLYFQPPVRAPYGRRALSPTLYPGGHGKRDNIHSNKFRLGTGSGGTSSK